MKIRAMVLTCMAGAIVLFLGHQYSSAQPESRSTSLKIGIVSIRKVFRNCKRNAQYRAESLAEQSKLDAEEKELSQAAAALEAGLSAFKPGSSEYMAQVKELFGKQADLRAMQEFNKRQRVLKDQLWTEQLFKETLAATRELAKDRGLSLVLEADEPEFPVQSGDELMMALQTHKVLYSEGCLDLTAAVVARLDEKDDAKK